MKIKLTPLNIISALSITAALALLVNKSWLLAPQNYEFSNILIALCVLVLFVSFLCDQIFRKFIANLRRLWLMQLMMIVILVIFVLILKISIFN